MKKIYMIFVALIMMLFLVLPATADWPMFHHDLALSGYTDDSRGPNINAIYWIFETAGAVYSSPAIVDGIVYIGSDDGYLYAIDAYTGIEEWSYDTGAPIRSSPAVENDIVYTFSTNGYLYALDAYTGAWIWEWNRGPGSWDWSSPAVHGGYVFIGSSYSPGTVFCLNAATGAILWSTILGANPNSQMAVWNGKVYSGTHNFDNNAMTLTALDETTGGIIWEYDYSAYHPGSVGMINHNGVTIADGDDDGDLNVYFGIYVWGAPGPQMICLNEVDGTEVWTTYIGADTTSTPAYHDGVLFIGSDDNNVYALDASDGSEIWTYATGGIVMSAPAVADGKVYFGSLDHIIYCVDETTGALIWQYDTGASHIYGSPAISDDILFIGNENGKVYAFKDMWRDETGWGDGIDFPGSDWSMYFEYEREDYADEILLITYHWILESNEHDNIEDALSEAGYTATNLINPASGDIATELNDNDYDQIWFWDVENSLEIDDDDGDISAIVDWYDSHEGNIVIDARSYGAIFQYPDDKLFIENIADAFSVRGGGLWIGCDHADMWAYNANALLTAMGYDNVIGSYDNTKPITGGDTTCDLLTTPNPLVPTVLDWSTQPWSIGEAPTGVQSDGVELLPLVWNVDDISYTSYQLGPITYGTYKTDIIADGGSPATAIDVGDITVWNTADTLYVLYELFDGWLLNKTHVDIVDNIGDFPTTKVNKQGNGGSPKVGKFEYSNDTHYLYPNSMRITYLYEIPWTPNFPTYIAAHAELGKWIPAI